VSERCVLRSYAVLALLDGARRRERAREILAGAAAGKAEVSTTPVNVGEATHIVKRR